MKLKLIQKMNKKYTIDEYLALINARLTQLLPNCDFGFDIVHEAMKYSLQNGGKRIRPVLTLEFCRLCGGDIMDALDLACAVEMIHTYSLIHDDLPCMDNDDMRRGKPSCHIRYGENYALLAGDGLLTIAFEVIAKSSLAVSHPDRALKAISVLASNAGCMGMIGGQVVDLKSEGFKIDLETLRLMDSLKTGALIKAAAMLGVIAAGKEEFMHTAQKYTEFLGHAFQIVDDILDVTADEAELGKPVGSDMQNEKSTYISLLGLEESKRIAEELTNKAIDSLDSFGENAEFLRCLTIKLLSRKK